MSVRHGMEGDAVATASRPAFLVHEAGAAVGVAVDDLEPGMAVGRVLQGGWGETVQVEVRHAIPLGHKVALRPIAAGEDVVEYGGVIGQATRAIAAGEHVHVHNLKSRRWA